jgi:hypothetical protein
MVVTAARADDAAEARTIGAAAASALQASTTTTANTARGQTPGYTATPPEAMLDMSNLNASSSALLTLCQTTPNDPSCEAILKARADAVIKVSTPSMISDSTVQSALTVKGSLAGSVLAGYSDCGTDVTQVGKQYFQTQSCFSYEHRTPDQHCTKTRLATILNWYCPNPSFTGPLINASGHHYCEYHYTTYSCASGETQIADSGALWCMGFTPPTPPAIIPLPYVRAADSQPVTLYNDALPNVYQYWNNGCAAYEARVPSGMLPPDGDNLSMVGAGTTTTAVNSCMRNNSVCTDPTPQSRNIGDNVDPVWVTNACWQYTNTFDCIDPASESDCSTDQWGQCTPVDQGTCIDFNPVNPTHCTAKRYDYSCLSTDTRETRLSANCAGRTFTDDYGVRWPAGHAPNKDLPQAVAIMEAGREAGTYLSKKGGDFELFKGFDNRCVKKLGGLVNCCTKTGGLNLGGFSNMAVASTAGHAVASTYTYDMLFASDAPQWLVSGFQSLFDGGFSSSIAAFAAGDLAMDQLLQSMIPGPWSMALIAVQLSGITSCPSAQKITSIKRGGNLCVDLGDYCSKSFKALFLKICLERTQSACCFNSKLAKAINTQGKAQLGISMGTATAPNCGGFTIDQFQRLDLSRMDFTEFMEGVKAQAVDAAATVQRANPMACYYGKGKC